MRHDRFVRLTARGHAGEQRSGGRVAVSDGIIVADAAGHVRFVSDSAARIARCEGDPDFRTRPFETLAAQR